MAVVVDEFEVVPRRTGLARPQRGAGRLSARRRPPQSPERDSSVRCARAPSGMARLEATDGEGSSLRPARPQIRVDGQGEPIAHRGPAPPGDPRGPHGLFSCEATFGNWGPASGGVGFLYFGRDVLDFGKDVRRLARRQDALHRPDHGLEGCVPRREPRPRSPCSPRTASRTCG